jgi:hypothetical protein
MGRYVADLLIGLVAFVPFGFMWGWVSGRDYERRAQSGTTSKGGNAFESRHAVVPCSKDAGHDGPCMGELGAMYRATVATREGRSGAGGEQEPGK